MGMAPWHLLGAVRPRTVLAAGTVDGSLPCVCAVMLGRSKFKVNELSACDYAVFLIKGGWHPLVRGGPPWGLELQDVASASGRNPVAQCCGQVLRRVVSAAMAGMNKANVPIGQCLCRFLHPVS